MMLVWLDLETTGLDPRREAILEVAVAITTLDKPFEVERRFCWPIHYNFEVERERRTFERVVVDMHRKSGLWVDCAASLTTIKQVDSALLDLVPEVSDREQTPTLAGSSVHFDLGFLREHMPTLAARFSHRVYDVSAVKLFCRSLGMPKLSRAEAHRAAADVEESVVHARACASWLANEFSAEAWKVLAP